MLTYDVLESGTMNAAQTKLFRCDPAQWPNGIRVIVNVANRSTATTFNLYVKPQDRAITYWSGKDAVLAVNSSQDFPGYSDGFPLGPGDEVWGDCAGSGSFIVAGVY